jgi:hypothetical protein
LTFVLILLAAARLFAAEASEEKAVLAVVQKFFDALAARDADAARAVLAPEGHYYSVRENGTVSGASHAELAARLPTGKEKLLERMRNPRVTIRGGIANVWTEYDFHRDGRFSHCGVDSFNLVRMPEGWKIAGLIYTVEPRGCPGQ